MDFFQLPPSPRSRLAKAVSQQKCVFGRLDEILLCSLTPSLSLSHSLHTLYCLCVTYHTYMGISPCAYYIRAKCENRKRVLTLFFLVPPTAWKRRRCLCIIAHDDASRNYHNTVILSTIILIKSN